MEIDRTLLTPEQVNLVNTWEEFFKAGGWQLLLQRFAPQRDALLMALDAVKDTRELGIVQGSREILRQVIGLEQIIEGEMQAFVGAMETEREEQEESQGADA